MKKVKCIKAHVLECPMLFPNYSQWVTQPQCLYMYWHEQTSSEIYCQYFPEERLRCVGDFFDEKEFEL